MIDYKFSIIIPAYNEAVLIQKTLDYLFFDDRLNNIELIVVCNGCEDNTGNKVRCFIEKNQFSLQRKQVVIVVIETGVASKTNALNLGVSKSSCPVKVFLDADIHMNGIDIDNLVVELIERKLKAISPKVVFLFEKSHFLVRQYYQVAQHSFYNVNHRLSNVIALSSDGVDRIVKLPDVIADDEYIRRQFMFDEIAVSTRCSFNFICAKTLVSLLQVLTRVERGNLQLNKMVNKSIGLKVKRGYATLPVLSFPFFFLIKFLAKVRAKYQFSQGKIKQWERDESNRKA